MQKEVMEEIKKLEEENKVLNVENNKLREETSELKKLKGVMEELGSMVECPVCLCLPRLGGPVPVCSNGHFVCLPCKDKIR